jgi:hypothetical protein
MPHFGFSLAVRGENIPMHSADGSARSLLSAGWERLSHQSRQSYTSCQPAIFMVDANVTLPAQAAGWPLTGCGQRFIG